MENAITAGLSKQIVLARALETTANNVANQTTSGFKADHIAFREYLAAIDARTSGDPVVSLVVDPDTYTDFSAGGLEQSYRDLDFAIDGDGFFAVETASGVRYTRDGRFSVNAYGELVNRSGAQVLDAGGSPVLIDPEAGPVLSTPDGKLQQNATPIAQLGVYKFDDLRQLRKSGDNLFAASDEPVAAVAPRVRQGFFESSNVNPVAAMTDMIEVMRAYEQAARLTETANDLERQAIETLGRTN
ncbi:MAG: flagellar basal-body rod protein FlgF [Alphaproteobacteria bacterium RIFCSPHIGHO2_12_FULL_63_12]|nr:MAG: flagellar basal-body rod protein FlgF [Alphaproteobacteria bacterium RIFCSPHIGHO2_12_FULL_63_12]